VVFPRSWEVGESEEEGFKVCLMVVLVSYIACAPPQPIFLLPFFPLPSSSYFFYPFPFFAEPLPGTISLEGFIFLALFPPPFAYLCLNAKGGRGSSR